VAGRHARLVLLGKDLTDEFSTAAHPYLVEDVLDVFPRRWVNESARLTERPSSRLYQIATIERRGLVA
jgi:hypothetical protein